MPFAREVPVEELFAALGGRDFRKKLFAVLVGHIDDSGSAKTHLLTLSCVVGHGGMWWWIEQAWLQVLQKKNAELKIQGRKQLSRYHAADCSNLKKEFADWTIPEQIAFTEQLIDRVFRRHPMWITSYTLDLRDLVAHFPEAKENPYGLAHVLLLHHIMKFIADTVLADKRYIEDRILLIHDRSDYDAVLLDAFNQMKKDEKLVNHERFTAIVPMGWEDCVPLQPADLLAYGNFRTVAAGHRMRKDLRLIVDLDSFGGRGVFLTKEAFKEIRGKQDEESLKALFEIARIRPLREVGSEPTQSATQRDQREIRGGEARKRKKEKSQRQN
jgi:hypothetical protein